MLDTARWTQPAPEPRLYPKEVSRLQLETYGGNKLIAALSREASHQLLSLAEPVDLKRRQVLQERNIPLRHAYFIESGAASLLARTATRSSIEIGTIGVRDMVGIPLILGTFRSPHRCVVQVPGTGLRIVSEHLLHVMDAIPELRRLLLAYVQSAMAHSAQLVACNTRHSLRQRLSRWLMVASDQLQSSNVPLTHECMSRALGVRRASITTTAAQMEKEGLIQRRRGEIEILDLDALDRASCGCHRAIKAEQTKALVRADRNLLCSTAAGNQ